MRQRIFIIPLVLAVCLLSAGWALGADADPWFGIPTAATNIILILTLLGLGVAQIYSTWNRSSYETRDKTIKDLNALLAARDAVIVEREKSLREAEEKHRAQVEALKAKFELDLQALETEVARLKVNNMAVTNVNLITVAELTKLRHQGLWKGHERDIFKQAGLEGYISDGDGPGDDG